jgi:hypothetical protein
MPISDQFLPLKSIRSAYLGLLFWRKIAIQSQMKKNKNDLRNVLWTSRLCQGDSTLSAAWAPQFHWNRIGIIDDDE